MPERLRHVLTIAKRVRSSVHEIAKRHPEIHIDEAEAESAALLHDIGYAPDLVDTGFHPLDGARFLKASGFPRLAELIEGHSCSPEEAEIQGFSKIVPSQDLVAKLITYWDMRTQQGGTHVSYEERLRDILQLYGETSTVGRANILAKPRLERLFEEVEALLAI